MRPMCGDTERNGADIRLHVCLLYHLPRMISTIGHVDYSVQIMPSIYGPNFANLSYSQNSPSSTQRTTNNSLNWSRHLSYPPYMRSISKHFAKVFKPTDTLSPRLRTGSSSCTSSAETLISIAGISLNILLGTPSTTVLTSFRTAHHPFWPVKGRKCRSVSKALFPERNTECGSREGCETESRWTSQDLHHDEWKGRFRRLWTCMLRRGRRRLSGME